MSKEEVASIMAYCKEHSVSYKSRLQELNIPQWRFYDSKRRYADEESQEGKGEFLQLQPEGVFTPAPSFRNRSERLSRKRQKPEVNSLSVDLKLPNGAMMRVQGNMSLRYLEAIIQTAVSHV